MNGHTLYKINIYNYEHEFFIPDNFHHLENFEPYLVHL